MQLGADPIRLPSSDDLATALRTAAEHLGHRPAVTVLREQRREEQGFASLYNWASKGAHYLELEHLLEPGDRIGLVGPPGWVPAAVCLAAWWAGVTVVAGPGVGSVDVAVVHESVTAPEGAEVVPYGDAVDGAPLGDVAHEPYVIALQAFPDSPPTARARPEQVALEVGDRRWTQQELLDEVAAESGVLGLDGMDDPALWLPAVAVRPLVTGKPTVVLDGQPRDAASGERVAHWR